MRSSLRFVLVTSILSAIAGAAIAGSRSDGPWDVTLGESGWNVENRAGSPASARDKLFSDALSAAFGGDSAAWCKEGACWIEVRDVACDRGAATCTATGAADVNDPETPFALRTSGKAARALIGQLAQRSLCGADRCAVGAIACFTDRHDELGGGGRTVDAHRTYTCQIHRAPLPADPPDAP